MRSISKRNPLAGLSMLGLLISGNTALALNIQNVQVTHWAGTGSKKALMVVDWQQAETFVFGYRWEDTATGLDMIEAVNSAGIGFYRQWHPDYQNQLIFGLGFDVDQDGGSFVPGAPGPHSETGYATDPDDYYAEGWYVNGYWAYYSSQDGANWAYASEGLAHQLADGAWDGWSFAPAPTWDGGVPDNIPLVPEPATALLLSVAGLLLRAGRAGPPIHPARGPANCRHPAAAL